MERIEVLQRGLRNSHLAMLRAASNVFAAVLRENRHVCVDFRG